MNKGKNKLLLLIVINVLVVVIAVLYFNRAWFFEDDISLNILASFTTVSQVGKVEGISQNIIGVDGKEGFLLHGRNIPLKKGSYKVSYKVKLVDIENNDDSEKSIGYCKVNLANAPKYNKKIELKAKDFLQKNLKKIIINFTVPEGYPSIEFQVFQFSGNNLSIESLRLNSIISERIPLRTKEVKKAVLNIIGMIVLIAFFLLFIILRFKKLVFFILFIIIAELWFLNIEHSSDILTGCAMYSPIGKLDSFMHIKANDTKEGYLAYGPYLPLEKGRYRVNYKVFLDNLDSGDDISRKVGYCDIDIEGHPELRKFSEFTVGSFKKRNPQEVSLTFSVPEGMPKTQYRVYQYGGNKLTLSSLKLYDVDITKYIRTHLDILLIAIFITIIFI
ncbi:MAG TPA: hypothetical protein DCP53_00215 [Elusimicrobia bacterium]|nr:hypothetical protein [Elusimicrobiota bacterium]